MSKPLTKKPLKILYFGIYSKGKEYPRNTNLILGLELQNVQVSEAHFSLSETFHQRMAIVANVLSAAVFGFRILKSYLVLTRKFVSAAPVDAVIVGHPGYFHIHLARLLRTLFRKRTVLIYDAFIPLYDALVADRKLLDAHGFFARLLYRFERACCRASDHCLTDTQANRRYLIKAFGLSPNRVHRVFVGPTIRPRRLFPKKCLPGIFKVLYCGTYIPLHGVEVILKAAEKLQSYPDIRFTMVGSGQRKHQAAALARRMNLSNVRFRGWVQAEEISEIIRSCHLSLGIFGSTPKAKRVIPSKIFDICAVGAPFITADTDAIKEVFTHRENAYLIPLNDPQALVEAILKLKSDPELMEKVAHGASRVGQEQFSFQQIGEELAGIVQNAVEKSFP